MPLVRISLLEGKSLQARQAISEAVHQALVDTINVPANDRFQIISQHTPDSLIADPTYLGIDRSADVIVIQITLNTGRTIEMKRALYKRVAELLADRAQVRPQDVIINLIEVPKENWSFGNGLASYVPQENS